MNPRFSADIPSCNQNATLSFPHLCNGYPFKPWNVHEIILSLIFLPSSSNPQREYLESILPLHPDISMWSLWSYEQMKNQFYWCLGEGRRDLTKEKPFLGPVWEITAMDLQLRAGPGRESARVICQSFWHGSLLLSRLEGAGLNLAGVFQSCG